MKEKLINNNEELTSLKNSINEMLSSGRHFSITRNQLSEIMLNGAIIGYRCDFELVEYTYNASKSYPVTKIIKIVEGDEYRNFEAAASTCQSLAYLKALAYAGIGLKITEKEEIAVNKTLVKEEKKANNKSEIEKLDEIVPTTIPDEELRVKVLCNIPSDNVAKELIDETIKDIEEEKKRMDNEIAEIKKKRKYKMKEKEVKSLNVTPEIDEPKIEENKLPDDETIFKMKSFSKQFLLSLLDAKRMSTLGNIMNIVEERFGRETKPFRDLPAIINQETGKKKFDTKIAIEYMVLVQEPDNRLKLNQWIVDNFGNIGEGRKNTIVNEAYAIVNTETRKHRTKVIDNVPDEIADDTAKILSKNNLAIEELEVKRTPQVKAKILSVLMQKLHIEDADEFMSKVFEITDYRVDNLFMLGETISIENIVKVLNYNN